jgi:hypothetical protein
MITKSIRLSEDEASQLKAYVQRTGEVEASALKRAALRGLHDLRVEQGILAYLDGYDSGSAAAIAGIGRAQFLWLLSERGVTLLREHDLAESLRTLAQDLNDPKLTAAAKAIEDHQRTDRDDEPAHGGTRDLVLDRSASG